MDKLRYLAVTLYSVSFCLACGHAAAQVEMTTPYGSPTPAVTESPAAETPAAETPAAEAPAAEAPAAETPASAAPEVVPEPAADDRRQLVRRTLELDERMAAAQVALSSQRRGPPIGLMVAGYTIGTFSAFGVLGGAALGRAVRDDIRDGTYHKANDLNADDRVDATDRRIARNVTIAYSGLALVHLGLGAFATWWLMKRAQKRSELMRELGTLRDERKAIELKLDLALSATGALGSLRGAF